MTKPLTQELPVPIQLIRDFAMPTALTMSVVATIVLPFLWSDSHVPMSNLPTLLVGLTMPWVGWMFIYLFSQPPMPKKPMVALALFMVFAGFTMAYLSSRVIIGNHGSTTIINSTIAVEYGDYAMIDSDDTVVVYEKKKTLEFKASGTCNDGVPVNATIKASLETYPEMSQMISGASDQDVMELQIRLTEQFALIAGRLTYGEFREELLQGGWSGYNSLAQKDAEPVQTVLQRLHANWDGNVFVTNLKVKY